jgi:hypothetical protein
MALNWGIRVPAKVSSRVYRHPLFSIGCVTFYSSLVSIRTEICESGGESATTAQCGFLSNLKGGRPGVGARRKKAPPTSSQSLVCESCASRWCLFDCQRAILPAPVKRADFFNAVIRLPVCGEGCKRLCCGLWGDALERCNRSSVELASSLLLLASRCGVQNLAPSLHGGLPGSADVPIGAFLFGALLGLAASLRIHAGRETSHCPAAKGERQDARNPTCYVLSAGGTKLLWHSPEFSSRNRSTGPLRRRVSHLVTWRRDRGPSQSARTGDLTHVS